MNIIYKIVVSSIITLAAFSSLHAQTASVSEGCVPLEVNFSPPTGLSAFFWDFKDGTAGSQNAAPSHIFSSPGVYEVTLNEGAAGNQVGTVTITVLPDIDINIAISLIDPCNPRRFQFTNNSTVPAGVNVTGYQWIFGDGSSSGLENPTHNYAQPGPKSVSLEIFTDIAGCDNSELFENIITVSNDNLLNSFFSANPSATCDVPATIFFNTGADLDPSVDYLWDFGDGNTTTNTSNTIHQYTQEGVYTATLTLTKGDCVSTFDRLVSVGAPLADFGFNDTLCINSLTTLINNTAANTFIWTFEPSVEVQNSTISREPIVIFTEEGLTTINMVGQVGDEADCTVDTTFQVYIQDPQVEVIVDPEISCANPLNVQITTTEEFDTYTWYGQSGNMTYTAVYEEPERDSFYVNEPDTMDIDLVVTTAQGCVGVLEDYFIFQNPEAHFIPNRHHGCAPLSVVFRDTSTSAEPIINYTYDYGNGDTQSFTNNNSHEYTFTDPGEYYVTLVVENAGGCIDTSWAVLIEVGAPLDLSYDIDKTDICIGDTITLSATNIDPRIDAFNLWTDEGRSHHCEMGSILEHQFITSTGTFDIEYTVDYNGCRTTIVDTDAITVNGPKADLWYMINCDDPLAVMFADSSQDATSILWSFDNGDSTFTTSTESELTHTFPESGDYKVYLEAFNDQTGCPSQLDSVIIHARQIDAQFDMPDNICDNLFYNLDATTSVDVDNDCSKGYTWTFTLNGRPRRVGEAILEHIFPVSGTEILTLEVVDINGCTDSVKDTFDIFGIQPDFVFDKEPICFPTEINFTNQSIGDTTITSFSWLHNVSPPLSEFSTDENPAAVFDFFTEDLSQLPIFLAVKDELGCEDTIQHNIEVYRPLTNIIAESIPICIGDTVRFEAMDITGQGSTLDYIWNFGNGQTSLDSVETIMYNTAGTYGVTLNLTEESTGCQNQQRIEVLVTEDPIAAFQGFDDGMLIGPADVLCFPGTIDFQDQSIANNNPLSYLWAFSNGAISQEQNPVLTFPRGEHDATLIITSDYGCADTVSQTYTIVGAEGMAVADKLEICKNDSITFNLVDTLGVESWQWDFGLGEVFTDIDPITQVFPDSILGNTTIVTLSLLSEGIACEVIDTITVEFFDNVSDTVRQTISVIRGEDFELPINVSNPNLLNWEVEILPNTLPAIIPPGIECLNCNNPSIDTDTDSCYVYAVSYLDADACIEQVFIYEIAPIPLEYGVPNIFTPNGDGANDFFNLVDLAGGDKGSAIEEVLDFRVYNRWGKLVYENTDPAQGWNGLYEGEMAPAEVYGFYIQARLIDGSIITEKGDVTLIR